MLPTTFVAVALSVVLAGETAALTPDWQTDYHKAVAVAGAQQKPIAVFIGQGEAGYSRLVSEGSIPAEAGQLLAKNYVCVYVDTDTAAGKALAGDFALSTGLVISNKGGSYQALRHTGTVSPADLTGYLTRYGTVTTVTTTAERGLVPVSAVSPGVVIGGGCPNGRCGTVITGGYGYPATTTLPYGYAPYPVMGGCPNGRCPNAR